VVTGEKGAPEAMIHFALSPDGVVVPDIRRKLPGRGVWILGRREHVAQAVKKQAFSRGFRTRAAAADDLAAQVDALLEQDALQFLSIVNKAGLVIAGATKVEAAIQAGGVVALFRASDGSRDGAAKLEGRLRSTLGERAAQVARINLFSSAQLDLALGRANVIHAALNEGEASTAFLERLRRLACYRFGEQGNSPEASMDADPSPDDGRGKGMWKDA
jgi:predicted RNA-binding protein YlxR (DUF448 family)